MLVLAVLCGLLFAAACGSPEQDREGVRNDSDSTGGQRNLAYGEYIIVYYPEERTVLVDGERRRQVGEPIEVEPGEHTISLEGPADFEPREHDLTVRGTTAVLPLEVEFTPLDPPAAGTGETPDADE